MANNQLQQSPGTITNRVIQFFTVQKPVQKSVQKMGQTAATETVSNDYYMTGFVRIILGFLAVFIAWMTLAPIQSSVITSGEIVVLSERKQVQHLEGGIIAHLHVQEGAQVNAGDPLVTLDTTAVAMQLVQVDEGIRAAEFQQQATRLLIATLEQELAIVNRLLSQNNASLVRQLDLQKQLHQSQATLGEIGATIARLRSERVVNDDQLRRAIIRAPVSGFVLDLKHHTVGGVIAPGDKIMDIVPQDELLIAEVRIKPEDIDSVRLDLVAKVQLMAFNTRLVPKLAGTVIGVSADSFKNDMTGEVYFMARIHIPDDSIIKEMPKLVPGMPVNAFIITGSRTLWQYLITPIRESAYKAFREV